MATSTLPSIFNGTVESTYYKTNAGVWIPARKASFYTGTWTDTRLAEGSYVMRKTAADNAGQAVFHLGDLLLQRFGTDPMLVHGQAMDVRGVRLTAIDVVYGIGTIDLDAHTYDLAQTTFANGVAPAVVDTVGGTLSGTLAVADAAQPYVTQIALGTPYVLGGNEALRNVVLEISWDAAATSVLDYYGLFVRFDYNV